VDPYLIEDTYRALLKAAARGLLHSSGSRHFARDGAGDGAAVRRPVPEPSLSFAAFTDTHIGQKLLRPQWGYAKYLDRLADDIMDNALPCEFVVHLGDGAYNKTAFVNGVGLPKAADAYRDNLKAFLVSHLHVQFH